MKTKTTLNAVIHLLLTLALSPIAANAAENPSVPVGPLLQTNPDFCAWEIKYSYPSDTQLSTSSPRPSHGTVPSIASLSSLPPRTYRIVRTNSVTHAIITDVAGGTTEEWFDGLACYLLQKGFPPLFADHLDLRFPDFRTTIFPDFDWIAASTFAGTEMIDARLCLYFKKADVKAWIDAKTRFPVRWERKGEIRSFTELASPANKLSLPEELLQLSHDVRQSAVRRQIPVPN